MKRLIVPVVLVAVVLTWGGLAFAQNPAPPPGPQHMAEMCRQMMEHHGGMMGGGMGAGMMGGGMGGMMGGGMMMGGDPKQQADMMAMRGEMMKAMGEIMLKYSQRLSPAK